MLNGSRQQQVVIEKLDDDANVSNNHKTIVTREPGNHLLFPHDTVVYVTGGATTIGTVVGGFVGNAYGADIAQQASDAMRETIKQKGDELAEKVMKETGLNRIPGGTLLIKNQVTEIAHQVGETTYRNVKDEITTRSATMGGAAAGIMTVVVMEGANLISYLYGNYRKHQAAIEGQRQAQQALAFKNQEEDNVEDISIEGIEFRKI